MIDNVMLNVNVNVMYDVIKKIFIPGVKFSETLTPWLTMAVGHTGRRARGTVDGGERCAKRSV